MKKLLVLSLGLLTATLSYAQTTTLQDLDLSSNEGFPYITKAPAGATVKEKYGELQITLGKSFEVTINSMGKPYDVAKRKAEIKANTVNVLKKWVVDAPDGGIYETDVFGRQQYHFFHTVKIGEDYVMIEDNKNGDAYTLAQAQTMYEAAKATHQK
ncbi:MAG: hypothetical protein JSS76_16170 [Bacteroidetes bacterium]|nr:hypothetical protein [Bacteroidota bacterium]